MSMNMTKIPQPGLSQTQPLLMQVRRFAVLIALIVICMIFAINNPIFLRPTNIINIFDHITILLIVAMAMTAVVTAGGMDLSVGISLDIGAMISISMIAVGINWPIALIAGLFGGIVVGVFSGFLIVKIGIGPFLATLSIIFVGQSLQRILTRGGEPIYLISLPPGFAFLGQYKVGGLFPFETILALIITVAFFLLLEKTRFGKSVRAIGLQYNAARIAGIRVEFFTFLIYLISGFVCAFAGILLASRLDSFVPLTGQAYMLDAIGAVFVGTMLDKESRANVPGTFIGVLLIGVVSNGLNLMGVNFYWKTVGKGLLILIALVLGALNRKKY